MVLLYMTHSCLGALVAKTTRLYYGVIQMTFKDLTWIFIQQVKNFTWNRWLSNVTAEACLIVTAGKHLVDPLQRVGQSKSPSLSKCVLFYCNLLSKKSAFVQTTVSLAVYMCDLHVTQSWLHAGWTRTAK